ncbi:ATP-binding protein [Streptomyces sp. NPDC050095]|uniref:ATP-binding protein n=1 Tax=unclassified Streptomyces TaxID=2593676 RepID=UPI00341301E0
MYSHRPSAGELETCVEDLRRVLAARGVTLPSLGVDLPSFAGAYAEPAGLVVLGNCNLGTARRLVEAIGGAEVVLLEREFVASAKALAGLRREVEGCLGDGPVAEVQLCVGELVANVVRHVGEGVPVGVRVLRGGCGLIRVEVWDPEPRVLPVLRDAGTDDEGGRGLAVVGAAALRWGVVAEAGGKTVWCEMAGDLGEAST